MAQNNILDEYLVKLGFATDSVGYSRFANQLRDASSLVNNTYFSMGKKVLEFQAAATGMFAAIGLGAIGFADKVAMADQDYRLLALRMYTSLPVARELKIALDALGQPLENVMWDPELAARFHQLVKDQQTLTQQLGPDFEKQMLKIRDVRFEFTRFGVELQYLTFKIVEDLAHAFGTNIDGLLEKLRNLNSYILSHMPEIANWIATRLQPLLLDVKDIFWATAGAVKQLGVDFIQLVGIFSGDKSLENTTGSVEDLAKAVLHVANALKTSLVDLAKFEKNFGMMFSAASKAIHGDFSGAVGDLKQMDYIVGGEAKPDDPMVTLGALRSMRMTQPQQVKDAIKMMAKSLGVPEDLALAVAQQESNFQQFDKSGKVLTNPSGAAGIMQIMPETQQKLRRQGYFVHPEDPASNIYGGVLLLKQLLDQYKDQFTALSHYGGRGGPQSQQYAREVMGREAAFQGDVNVTVHVNTNDGKRVVDEIMDTVADAFDRTMKNRVQRNLSEFSTYGAY